MARLNQMMLTYFVTAALMWATGFLSWNNTGLLQYMLAISGGDISGNGAIETQLIDIGGPVGNIVNTLGGGLLAVWGLLVNIVTFTFWPVTVLNGTGAPIEVVVLLGGPPCVAFVGAFAILVRGSA